MSGRTDDVASHYGGAGLKAAIEAALVAAGKDLDRLATRDLAPVDEFHSRGRKATEELADLAEPDADSLVLDVGSGIGGPARYLAERFGCRVVGVDLTPAFCDVATWLSELTGLDGLTRFVEGSGTDIPQPSAHFDAAWTIQMQMNVERKSDLYAEIHRVLRPGGQLLVQELCAGEAGPCAYPTPWAGDASISFLATPDELCSAIEAAGFERRVWRDTTEGALEWYARHNARTAAAPSPLGTHIVMGEAAPQKRANVERNYAERRLRQVLGAFVKR